MAYNATFAAAEPARAEIDARRAPLLLEFGVPWCPWCIAAQPRIEAAMATHDGLEHVKIEDGPGRRLGRSFHIKLWPTLVFLRDGVEVERLVRPASADDITAALERLAAA